MIKTERKDSPTGVRIEHEHECFGIAQFNRFTSNHSDFFGAECLFGDGIRFTVSPCVYVETDFGDKYVSDGATLIDIRMTHNQFAELVSCMNVGEGVPVTITRFNGNPVPYESVNKAKRSLDEEGEDLLNKHLEAFESRIKVIENILDKKNIGIKDRNSIMEELSVIKSHMKHNIPYYKREMSEKIQDQCSKAKSEINQVFNNRMTMKGHMQALSEYESDTVTKRIEENFKK